MSGAILASTCIAVMGEVLLTPRITLIAAFCILLRDSNLEAAAEATATIPYKRLDLMKELYTLVSMSRSAPHVVPAKAFKTLILCSPCLHVSSMCAFQVSVGASSITPRYLNSITHSMLVLCSLSAGRYSRILFLVKHMAFVLLGFMRSCHVVVQASNSVIASWINCIATARSAVVTDMAMSSAYSYNFTQWRYGMSASITLKSIGLRVDP